MGTSLSSQSRQYGKGGEKSSAVHTRRIESVLLPCQALKGLFRQPQVKNPIPRPDAGVLPVAADLRVAWRANIHDLVTSRVGDAPQAIARANHLVELDLPPEDAIRGRVDGAEPPPPRLRAGARDGVGRENAEVAGDGADPFFVV